MSIVLPTKNGGRFLGHAIQSCIDQAFLDWELIVVDDASDDNTPDVIAYYESHDRRIRSVRHQKNRKLPAALNSGFAITTGKFLTWTSDDNCYRPNALARLVNCLEVHSEAGVVYADYTRIDSEGTVVGRTRVGNPEGLATRNSVGPCFLYRRAVQEKNGPYAEDLYLAEDYDFWMRASTSTRFHRLQEDLYLYRIHQGSLTSRETEHLLTLATALAIERNLPSMNWLANADMSKGFMRLADLYKHMDSGKTRSYFCKSLRISLAGLAQIRPGLFMAVLLGSRCLCSLKRIQN